MAAPEGYELLARIGFVDRGNYAATTTYVAGDVVFYNGSSWKALKDNLKGVTPAEGTNWNYMAKGYPGTAAGVSTKDNSGVLGAVGANSNAQAIIDEIANRVMTKLLLKSNLISQIINDPNKIASMAALFAVNQDLITLNSDKASKTELEALSAANTVLGGLKYLPATNIDNPNAFLRLTGWENSAYMSYVSLPALSGFTLVLGIYDHNNGTPKGRQFAITPGKLASRGYSAGAWTTWVDK